jgi:hypothetical protein
MAGDPFVRAEEVESEASIVGAKRTRIMRAAAGLSTDFLAPIESLASEGELREIGTLRAPWENPA